MLACLKAPPTAPPRNALAKRPDIARAMSLYWMTKNLGTLPDPGGLLDQRADTFTYFAVFASTEAEHAYNERERG